MRTCKEIQRDLAHKIKLRSEAEKVIKRETNAIKKHLGHRNARPYWMYPTASSRRVARALEARTRRHTTASLKYMRLNDEVVNLREALKSCKRKSR